MQPSMIMDALILPKKETAPEPIDVLQYGLSQLPQLEQELTHLFPPGMYVRQLFMPKGSLWMSRTHKTEHPFCVSKGRLKVWSENDGAQEISAPFLGITKPGARRIFMIEEDTLWTTFHINVDNETDADKLVERLTDAPDVSHVRALMERAISESRKEIALALPLYEC